LIQLSSLERGTRVVTETIAGVSSVSIGIWVGVGSRDERPSEAGASHFLEHLLFKGTTDLTASQLAKVVDRAGGDMNAFTTKEYTVFYLRLLSEDFRLGLDIMCDIMSRPALRPEDVEAERHVILDEILMHADEPADLAAERFNQLMFPDHPLGREVLGVQESVASLTRDDIRQYFETHYLSENMVVAVAGNVHHDDVVDVVNEALQRHLGRAELDRRPPLRPPEALDVIQRPIEQAHVILGVRAPERRSQTRFALGLLNQALGGGISSRLFQEIREKRGLAYSVWSDRAAYDDAGTFYVAAGSSPDKIKEVIELLNTELDRLSSEGLSEEELDVARKHIRAETLLSSEDTGARMSRLGASVLLYDEPISIDDILKRFDAVTLEEVNSLAAALFDKPRTMSIVGPFDPSSWTDELLEA